jgi:hypothetical protein
MQGLEKEELIAAPTDDLVNTTMNLSRELRFRWHEGLEALCQYFEKTFLKLNTIVAWKDDKLYLKIDKIKTKMISEVLYPAIEDMETRYPMSTYVYVYDKAADELMSFKSVKDGPEKTATVIIEYSTPMEDRPVFECISDALGIDSVAFMEKLESTYAHTLPHKEKWPFESRDAVPQLKAWPSRQEGPPDLELILDKLKETR